MANRRELAGQLDSLAETGYPAGGGPNVLQLLVTASAIVIGRVGSAAQTWVSLSTLSVESESLN